MSIDQFTIKCEYLVGEFSHTKNMLECYCDLKNYCFIPLTDVLLNSLILQCYISVKCNI